MTILRITEDCRVLTVAASDYLARHPKPATPQDLHAHNCVRFRAPRDGSTQPWGFTKGDQHIEIAVDGSLVVNDIEMLLRSVLDGSGVGHLPEPIVAPYLAEGRLVSLLEDWSITKPGIFLYHPSRRQTPMPLQVFLRFVEKWRKRALVADPVVRTDGKAAPQQGIAATGNNSKGLRKNPLSHRTRNAGTNAKRRAKIYDVD